MNTSDKIKIMQAYLNGETIQERPISPNYLVDESGWNDINTLELNEEPVWDWNTTEYRIKPVKKYRPYNSMKEFLEAQKEHGTNLYNTSRKQMMVPVICREKEIFMWWNEDNDFPTGYSFNDLFNYFKWQDDSVCGVLDEN